MEDPVAEEPGQRVLAGLLAAALVEQRLVDGHCGEAQEVQQQLARVGPRGGRARDGDAAHGLAGGLE